MKKIISLIAVTSILLMGLVSCNIEAERSYTGPLKIVVTGLPTGEDAECTALALFCNLNNWKADKVNGSDIYIADIEDDGTATFSIDSYPYSEKLQCQFTPMASRSTVLNESTWWAKAISGSDKYADDKNNLVYDFLSRGVVETLTLKLRASDKEKVGTKRLHYKPHTTALKGK